MKTRPFYLVVDVQAQRPKVVRTRQSWPALEPGEIVVRLSLEIPDDLIPRVQEFTVDDLDAMLYVTPEPVELPAEEATP